MAMPMPLIDDTPAICTYTYTLRRDAHIPKPHTGMRPTYLPSSRDPSAVPMPVVRSPLIYSPFTRRLSFPAIQLAAVL